MKKTLFDEDKMSDLWHLVSEENKILDKKTDAEIWEGIDEKISQIKRRKRLCYIASFLIMPTFGILFYYFSQNPVRDLVNAPNVIVNYSNQNEKEKLISLGDGTRIKLAPGGSLKLDEGFGKVNRNVKLGSNAYFEVRKNQSLPFIVHADGFGVTVLGTKFSILQSPSHKKVELYEGKIKINTAKGIIYLKPGNIWITENGKDKIFLSKTYSTSLTYHDENLDKVIRDIEETYNIKIKYPISLSDKKVKGCITGNLDEILNTIAFPFGLKTENCSNSQVILK